MTSDIDAIFVVERAAASTEKLRHNNTQQKFHFNLEEICSYFLIKNHNDIVIILFMVFSNNDQRDTDHHFFTRKHHHHSFQSWLLKQVAE